MNGRINGEYTIEERPIVGKDSQRKCKADDTMNGRSRYMAAQDDCPPPVHILLTLMQLRAKLGSARNEGRFPCLVAMLYTRPAPLAIMNSSFNLNRKI